MSKEQRKLEEPKCLHAITCVLFSCLVLVSEWQVTAATPIAAASSATATTRLRSHERPAGRGGGAGREGVKRFSRFGGSNAAAGGGSLPCEHKSLSELIKTSPVILKALGAHIFNHDDDEDLRILHNSNDALLLKWQNEQNKVLTSLKETQKIQKLAMSSSSVERKNIDKKINQQENERKQQQTFSDAATNRAAILASMNADAILITLTPETIYKGASLLKMPPNAAEPSTSHSTSSGNNNLPPSDGSSTSSNAIDSDNGNSANGGYNSGTINSSEASYLYDGQLNATVQPLSCFDENLLKMLPSDLIIFGKWITIEEPQRERDDLLLDIRDYTLSSSSSSLSQLRHQQQPTAKDVLKISINGLHRWSSQFENYIWKHLGWDDWSDFTVCSVACGKGVQQRFRRCLLDNPMVNLNMNFNSVDDENDVDHDDDDDDDDDGMVVDMDVDADVIVEVGEEMQEDSDTMIVDDETSEQQNTLDETSSGSSMEGVEHKLNENIGEGKEVVKTITTSTADVNHGRYSNGNVLLQTDTVITGNMLHFITTTQPPEIRAETYTTEEPEVMRIFEGHFNDTFSKKTLFEPAAATLMANNEKSFSSQMSSTSAAAAAAFTSLKGKKKDTRKLKKQQQQQQHLKTKHKKHKSAKLYSTMFCEGYNIEQRNCNSFECSDDINDLLKFYRKYPTSEETNTASTQAVTLDLNAAASASASASSSSYSTLSGSGTGVAFSSSAPTNSEIDGTGTNNQNSNTFTTPINMGYVQNWHNSLNFTIMLSVRAKNDSYKTATIFSIRNSTHNLYLESCTDGLRLYLERDKTTEMLPIKFNLYDYHWHQVAISIQNGDFISIRVDCSWTNSFVVSKRLFSLPVAADVEIGRGFNGELQQLLILPKHQERFQCSEKRTSINEVKRYIIDTFIDDYAN